MIGLNPAHLVMVFAPDSGLATLMGVGSEKSYRVRVLVTAQWPPILQNKPLEVQASHNLDRPRGIESFQRGNIPEGGGAKRR